MKKRVAAYARVSTTNKGAEHSIEFQSNYWNGELGNNPNYEYVGLFADKGISGRLANKRPQFMQMIHKAMEGQIDIIFTKSVQRFARNTEDLLTYVRQLREKGVSVIFEKENIDTLSIDSDLYLTIAAAVAEDDLSRYSQNVTWSIREKYKRGEPGSLGGRIYGYYIGKNQELTINEKEAEVIRYMFDLYLKGYSLREIGEELTAKGIPSANGGTWRNATIRNMLSNEKYRGDLLLQKGYCINGQFHINHGERDQYYVENHHEGIVSKEVFDKCQEELKRRTNVKNVGRKIKSYPFTGLIECSCCHKNFNHKMNHSEFKHPQGWWRCNSTRDKCTSTGIRDDILEEAFIEAFNEFVTMKYKGIEESDLQVDIDKIADEQRELTRLYANGWIKTEDYKKQYSEAQSKLDELIKKQNSIRNRGLSSEDFKTITIFDPDKVEKFISKCVVKGSTLEFHFYNGVIISKKIVNRRIYHWD